MKKFSSTRLPLILSLAAAFLIAFYSILGAMGQISAFHNVLGTIATPFRYAFSALGKAMGGLGDYFTEFDRLKQENKALEEELRRTQEDAVRAQVLEGENEWLRSYLGVKELLRDCTLVDALVIGRQAGSYLTRYTLDKGSLQGVEVDMAVITPDGIVGRVEEVGLDFCLVSTLVENASAVGAVDGRSGARGIVEGSLGLRERSLCTMSYVDETADVREGDVILSSGSGSVYPAGFVVGIVESLDYNVTAHTLTARIAPAVDFDRITRVMIVKKVTLTPAETSEVLP